MMISWSKKSKGVIFYGCHNALCRLCLYLRPKIKLQFDSLGIDGFYLQACSPAPLATYYINTGHMIDTPPLCRANNLVVVKVTS